MIRNIATGSNVHRPLDLLAFLSPSPASRHFTSTSRRSDQTRRRSQPRPYTPRGRLSSSVTQTTSRSRTPPRRREEEQQAEEVPRLPRYVRRQALAEAATAATTPVTSNRAFGKQPEAKYRSRNYQPSQEQHPKQQLKLLEPHVLSARLKKLCDSGHIDDAVAMLKTAPLDAQNTPVWNTLIWECLKAKRFKLGYELFVDMKRRGFSPTTRTFNTMFSGLSRIESWSTYPKQLANARSLYDAFQRHVNSIKKTDPQSSELLVDPLAAYIKILGEAGQYQEIFDVFYALDTEGPLAPNQFIFTAMFQAITRASGPGGGRSVPAAKSAGDAKLLWSQMLKASRKSPGFPIDSHTVTAAIIALSRGRVPDQNLAFSIVREYFGLSAPGEPPSPPGVLPLQVHSLAATLRLCNESGRHDACVEFFKQMKRRPEAVGGVSILDRGHMEEILKAYLGLPTATAGYHALDTLEWMLRQEITGKNGPTIRPSLSTYGLVFRACWLSVDWNSATRAFEIMTGYHCHDFMDGAVKPSPRFTKRAEGRNLFPTPECMSSMVKTAFASKNRAQMRQCLRIVDQLNIDHLLSTKTERANESNKAQKNYLFFASKLAAAIEETVEYVLRVEDGSNKRRPSQEEIKRWTALAYRSKKFLGQSGGSNIDSDFVPQVEKYVQSKAASTPLTRYEKSLRR